MIENPHKIYKKVFIVPFSLGGPDKNTSTRKFLFTMFNDKRIIGIPQPFRVLLAFLISTLRYKKSQKVYDLLGGGSPLLKNTEDQSIALQNLMNSDFSSKKIEEKDAFFSYRVLPAMQHSKPQIADIIPEINEFDPAFIVLLPLYPQYSTTTTESFFDYWSLAKKNLKSSAKVIKIIQYHDNPRYIDSCVDVIEKSIARSELGDNFTLLFSAHSLPEDIVKKGDPYQKQIEKCVELIVAKMKIPKWKLCYQSKVGPKKWIGPSLLDTIDELAKNGESSIAIFPIAFVSEHCETLVELDIEAKEHAEHRGITKFLRVPTVSTNEIFIQSLAEVVSGAVAEGGVDVVR